MEQVSEIKISSIITAKNEEANIRECINRQLNCIDEIIVIVDDKTTDKTLDIVKEFPQVKYEVKRWKGFAETKKYAASLANTDWILWIDADEVISDELSKEIQNFKNTHPDYNIYEIPRKAYFLGKWILHSGWYPGYVHRLFNKNKVSFNNKKVHEGLDYSGQSGRLKGDILHYTDRNINHYFSKFNSYTSLAANSLFEEKKKFRITDILLRPVFMFLKMYILKAGFLDGIQGFILAVFSSLYVFTKYCKLWELERKSKNK